MRYANVAAAERRCSEMKQQLAVAQRECTLSDRAVQPYKTLAEDLEHQLIESARKLTSLCDVLTSAVKELQPRCSMAAAVHDSPGRSARPVRDPPPIPSLLTISTRPPPNLRFCPLLSPPPASRESASSRSSVTETPIQPSTSWTLVFAALDLTPSPPSPQSLHHHPLYQFCSPFPPRPLASPPPGSDLVPLLPLFQGKQRTPPEPNRGASPLATLHLLNIGDRWVRLRRDVSALLHSPRLHRFQTSMAEDHLFDTSPLLRRRKTPQLPEPKVTVRECTTAERSIDYNGPIYI